MKKLASILLIAMLALSTVFANGETEAAPKADIGFHESGFPIVDAPLSFEMAAKTRHNKNFAELQFFQELEAKTGVHVNWNMSPEVGWDEKKGLLFAGELPDAFYGQGILKDTDVVNYGSQGLIIPLEDLIDQYCPNIKAFFAKGDYRKALTAPDGHIYALSNSTEISPKTHDKFFINKTWLDKLGLPLPTTLDEFVATLEAFAENDMNGNGRKDEIPFSFVWDRPENGLFSLFGMFGQLDDKEHWIVDENGNPVFTAVTEEWRDGIEFFHKLYEKGLMDPEGFTHDFNVFTAKVKSKDLIVGSFLGWSKASTAGPNSDHYVALPPLKNGDHPQIWRTFPDPITSKGSFAITSACEHPEVLMRWIDTHFEPFTSLQICQGLFGRTIEMLDDGTIAYLPLPEGKSFADQIHGYAPGVNGISAVTKDVTSLLHLNASLQERKELDEFYAPYNVPADQVYPKLLLTLEESDIVTTLSADILTYIDQCYANWIVNGGIEKEWNSYLEKLNRMGLEDYIKVYEGAYARYKSL